MKPLSAEEFAAILWPGMFKDGWEKMSVDDPWFQAHCYCLKKSEEMLKRINVYYRQESE